MNGLIKRIALYCTMLRCWEEEWSNDEQMKWMAIGKMKGCNSISHLIWVTRRSWPESIHWVSQRNKWWEQHGCHCHPGLIYIKLDSINFPKMQLKVTTGIYHLYIIILPVWYLWFAGGFALHSFNSLFDCFRGHELHRSCIYVHVYLCTDICVCGIWCSILI